MGAKESEAHRRSFQAFYLRSTLLEQARYRLEFAKVTQTWPAKFTRVKFQRYSTSQVQEEFIANKYLKTIENSS